MKIQLLSTEKTTGEFDHLIKWIGRSPIIIGILLLLLLVAYVIAFVKLGWSATPDGWGQFGDYIGGLLNPIVAICALVALVTSIKIQRIELAATREELASTKDVVINQTKIAEQQRREQRFFDVLRLYQETLTSVEFESQVNGVTFSYRGKSAFQYITTKSQSTGAGPTRRNNLPNLLKQKDEISNEAHTSFCNELNEWASLLDHYFRVIFLLLKEAEPTLGSDHYRYVKYLRAQLSKDELLMLTLNMLFDDEGKKMTSWAEKYGLLKHLPLGRLRSYAETRFEKSIFGQGHLKK